MLTTRVLLIDMDSGTVLNGPVYEVEVDESEVDAILDSDETARDFATNAGRLLS